MLHHDNISVNLVKPDPVEIARERSFLVEIELLIVQNVTFAYTKHDRYILEKQELLVTGCFMCGKLA